MANENTNQTAAQGAATEEKKNEQQKATAQEKKQFSWKKASVMTAKVLGPFILGGLLGYAAGKKHCGCASAKSGSEKSGQKNNNQRVNNFDRRQQPQQANQQQRPASVSADSTLKQKPVGSADEVK